jgi:hypothetical protein
MLVTIILCGGKVMRALFAVFMVVLFACPVYALTISDVNIAEEIMVDDGTALQLNGAGIRSKFIFDIYIAELYLEKNAKEAAEVIADPGHKRVVMHFLYKGVGQDKLVDGWNEGFSANLSTDDKARLQPRIDMFNSMFTEEMKSGDVVMFDYLPEQGTRVSIKGSVKGIIPGKDFNDALLSIWLGAKPVGSSLKKAMLGQ